MWCHRVSARVELEREKKIDTQNGARGWSSSLESVRWQLEIGQLKLGVSLSRRDGRTGATKGMPREGESHKIRKMDKRAIYCRSLTCVRRLGRACRLRRIIQANRGHGVFSSRRKTERLKEKLTQGISHRHGSPARAEGCGDLKKGDPSARPL
jgi:hypothetical protein